MVRGSIFLRGESHELVEHVQDVRVQVLREQKGLQGAAVLLDLLVVLEQTDSDLKSSLFGTKN